MFERYNRYVIFLYLWLNLEHLVFCWTEYSEGAASFLRCVSKILIQPHGQQQQREDDDDPDWDDDDLRLCLSVNGKIIALVCCLLNATKISLTLILQFGKLCKKEFRTKVVLFMSCQILEATKQKGQGSLHYPNVAVSFYSFIYCTINQPIGNHVIELQGRLWNTSRIQCNAMTFVFSRNLLILTVFLIM